VAPRPAAREHEAPVQARRSPRIGPSCRASRAPRLTKSMMRHQRQAGRQQEQQEPNCSRSAVVRRRDTGTLSYQAETKQRQRGAPRLYGCCSPSLRLAGPGRAKLALKGRLRRPGLLEIPSPALRHSRSSLRLFSTTAPRRPMPLPASGRGKQPSKPRAQGAYITHRALVAEAAWSSFTMVATVFSGELASASVTTSCRRSSGSDVVAAVLERTAQRLEVAFSISAPSRPSGKRRPSPRHPLLISWRRHRPGRRNRSGTGPVVLLAVILANFLFSAFGRS